ncbi:LysR family transcriptional regulator [Eleftheria terrae]|uniref:LysR family transcriptional regulator n=1 Tax=Eleftheria terrae TaxID=1597781 RepID=UPI00263B5EAE|nr:LysR family transcriptional regulator [Eleftheria terrae]WKB55180.1 LysR family transcriptional regulator [Eleftheria terrae]
MEQLKRMAVLASVVEHGSMSAAARALGTTTSAVSQQVRQLEREMGVTLLHRSSRKLQLTEAGERFHAGCAAMLAAARSAGQQLAQMRDAPLGELRVASPVGFARHLGPALAPLLAGNAGLTLHLQVDDALIDLVDARIDLAIRFGRLPDSSWVAQRLIELDTMICASPGYLAQRGVPATPQELAAHDWLRLDGRGPAPALELIGPHGSTERLRVRARATSNNQLSLQQLCEAGLGLAVLALQDIEPALQSGALVILLPDWRPASLPMYAVTPQRDTQPAKVRHAIAALQAYLQGLRGSRLWPQLAAAGAPGR